MKYVNILNSSEGQVFLRQIDHEKYDADFCFCENSNDNRVWDYVVVYEELTAPVKLCCKEGGLLFFSGESEDSRYYGKSFLKQFDCVVASHRNISHRNRIKMQTGLNWHFGYSYKSKSFNYDFGALAALPAPQKTKNISVITSNLCMMPEHVKRQRLIAMLRERFKDKIDFFGKGVKFVDDKAEALLPYRFHLCLENSNRPHYWTEKLADSLLGYCVPIYVGDPEISRYFDTSAFYIVDVNNPDAIAELIENILKAPEKLYAQKLPALIADREQLLHRHNFFDIFAEIVKTRAPLKENVKDVALLPNNAFTGGRLGMLRLRLRRLIFKKFGIWLG